MTEVMKAEVDKNQILRKVMTRKELSSGSPLQAPQEIVQRRHSSVLDLLDHASILQKLSHGYDIYQRLLQSPRLYKHIGPQD